VQWFVVDRGWKEILYTFNKNNVDAIFCDLVLRLYFPDTGIGTQNVCAVPKLSNLIASHFEKCLTFVLQC